MDGFQDCLFGCSAGRTSDPLWPEQRGPGPDNRSDGEEVCSYSSKSPWRMSTQWRLCIVMWEDDPLLSYMFVMQGMMELLVSACNEHFWCFSVAVIQPICILTASQKTVPMVLWAEGFAFSLFFLGNVWCYPLLCCLFLDQNYKIIFHHPPLCCEQSHCIPQHTVPPTVSKFLFCSCLCFSTSKRGIQWAQTFQYLKLSTIS